MRVPSPLASAFGAEFEELMSDFTFEQGLLPEREAIRSQRFLSRSIIPHIKKLSLLFNRLNPEELSDSNSRDSSRKALRKNSANGLAPYWKESSHPENLRLAYFLYFMPCNLFRTASVWSELARLGFKWKASSTLRAIEFGAGPASGASGIAAAEKHTPSSLSIQLPKNGNWALLEQDKAMLQLGQAWAERYFLNQGFHEWGIRPFHRKIDLKQGLLPRSAPQFNLWLSSYFLNELEASPEELATLLIQAWERHLEEEGIAILIEPALKMESRKLLMLRKALLEEKTRRGLNWLQILLPCLGHQNCGALANPDDWCHEEVTWWRPPYFRQLDQMAELDRKTLPFSYLVVTRSQRPREEILSSLRGSPEKSRLRLVSPSHWEGRDLEFFTCGTEGKRRARYRPELLPLGEGTNKETSAYLDRGDILLNPELKGDVHATRILTTGSVIANLDS